MALRQVILARKIADARSTLTGLQTAAEALKERREAMNAREAELEAAVQEVTDETPAEDREALDQSVSEFEAENTALEQEETENREAITAAEQTIADLQAELDEAQQRADQARRDTGSQPEERSNKTMNTRKFFGMTMEQRDTFFADNGVKAFVTELRSAGKEKRAVTGGALTIPEVMLPLIKEQVETRSKLLKYVNLQPVGGTSRTPVMGTIPEAVWTEMCGKINELALGFTAAEVDGYKVAGYLPICNALLEDNDVDLVANVVYALGRSIALALDKAIVYGTGTKMPQGIVTRLVQTAAPESYPTNMRAWADLHTSNVVSITAANSTGTKLFQSLITAFGAAKKAYGAEGKFWAMNEKTHMKLLAEAVNFNAEGALVAGLNNTMPVVGGDIVELDFMPDNIIVAGYGEEYLLAERAGMQVTSSEHVKFLDDQTVFMGKARYDGLPVIAEGFVAIGINAATVAANAVSFAADTANA